MSDRTRELECVISDLKQQVRDAERVRDELRHALQGLLDALPSATTHPAIKSARAAIARATGEQP